jgi:hypothetical protein
MSFSIVFEREPGEVASPLSAPDAAGGGTEAAGAGSAGFDDVTGATVTL